MRRFVEAFVMIVCVVSAFLAGAAWGQEPDASPGRRVVRDSRMARCAGDLVHSSGERPCNSAGVSVTVFAQTGPAVLARHLQEVAVWNVTAWKNAEAGAAAVGSTPTRRAPGIGNPGPTSVSPQPSASGEGDCYTNSPVPPSVVTRESNGMPFVVNSSSGAFGCYQLMPMHYASGGTCADLDRSVEGQKACASRLPASAWGM